MERPAPIRSARRLRYVRLDVLVEMITVAVAEAEGEPRSLGTIQNNPEAVRKLTARLGPVERLRVCYEAGLCGFMLYWQLLELGVPCAVIAPSLIPQRAGERVKTDRLDALRLVRCYRAGELVAILVPSKEQEACPGAVRNCMLARFAPSVVWRAGLTRSQSKAD